MACLHPITIKLPNGSSQRVSCGHCLLCLRDRQNSFALRFAYGMQDYSVNTFVTLTYRDRAIPKYEYHDCITNELESRNCLCYNDVQLWLKRLRQYAKRKLGKDDIKMVCCGEYGCKKFRPHYHLIIMGLSPQDLRPMLHEWYRDYGLYRVNRIGDYQFKSGQSLDEDYRAVSLYVSKYCAKGSFGDYGIFYTQDGEPIDGFPKPFIHTSINLGVSRVLSNVWSYFEFDSLSKYDSLDDFWKGVYVRLRMPLNFSKKHNQMCYVAMPSYFKNKLIPNRETKSTISFKTLTYELRNKIKGFRSVYSFIDDFGTVRSNFRRAYSKAMESIFFIRSLERIGESEASFQLDPIRVTALLCQSDREASERSRLSAESFKKRLQNAYSLSFC